MSDSRLQTANLKRSYVGKQKRQSGVALFISLVMLLILTVLGLSSVQTTSVQERMARNARDTNLAFQAAESALKDAEALIETFNSLVMFTGPGANDAGYYLEGDYDGAANWSNRDWMSGNGYIEAPTVIDGVAEPSKYIIEHLKTVVSDHDSLNLDNIGRDSGSGRTQIFRITVFGTGSTSTAHVMIQSTYGKRF
ncbi:MAG: pilus assembly protein PilX [Gammaproteobacteria bacterium]|jgi:type IV pilus assembly protein PilX|nr:pilus assembly protein PilX [Gammaproteobacteria bacterium]MBT3733634.1 pilus assembly protein PilX [Gammaproteobacteria bacterium]MBT3900204.1 pilus assembly protein PilX [Gammaproteobacteria bacterium]MDC1019467.1 PilX N-terminal domain-containing pilus assembly protein [Pseudomonadales bacterium]|tara:strand:- start:12768 stop:13352 length:585 start_codon:yes stop_codon:yes gene_type:complete